MNTVSLNDIKNLHIPSSDSHKGQNGRLLIIGGSHLFHAASLWSLQIASRIVDLVHYASIPSNNEIVQKAKERFQNGIVIERFDIESYIEEDDVILIGPGMVRAEGTEIRNSKFEIRNLSNIGEIQNEGLQTYYLTKYLLQKYPHKRWVLDAGALQMMDLEDIPKGAILTPHHKEFDVLISKIKDQRSKIQIKTQKIEKQVEIFAAKCQCIVLLKGEKDIVSDGSKIVEVVGGNAGMTKGGTGDVLAGLIASLYCKNDAWLAATAGSFINKKAGDNLFQSMGLWFNASDLADQIPKTMKSFLLKDTQ